MRESAEFEELRERLRRVVMKREKCCVAADIPVDRVTLYRILEGATKRPSLAVQEGIERVVDDFELRHDASATKRGP